MTTRREVLGWTAAGVGMVASGLARSASLATASRPLDILFLGGTGFIGPYQVEYALARGHRVTLFNRGRSTAGLFDGKAELLIGNRDSKVDQGLSALAGERKWDLVIDNSGYVPRHVRDSIELLKGRVRRYIYVSTVAVYDPANTTPAESSPLRPLPDPENEEFSWERYGPLKAECDRIVQTLGQRATIVRPCFIVGPKDETDRFTYWVDRMARGGDVLGPPDPKRELQWVDVRDLCPWIVGLGERDVAGIFNAAGPVTPVSWEQTLAELAKLSKQPVRFHWSTIEILDELKIDLPLVLLGGRTSRHFDNKASLAAGLTYRPLADTAAAILEWWRAQPADRRARAEDWPTPEKERAAIERLSATAAR